MVREMLDSKGQEIVEYALVLPLLLLLIFGIVDLGLVIFTYNSVSNAAREGARTGVVPNATEADIIDAAVGRTGGLALSDVQVISSTDQVTVVVKYDHSLITGPVIKAIGGSGDLTLRSTATMRKE